MDDHENLTGNMHVKNSLYMDESADNLPDYLDLLKNFTALSLEVSEYVFVNLQCLSGNKRAFVQYWHHFLDQYADIAIWDKQTAQPAMAHKVMDSRFEFILVFSHSATRAIGTRDFRGGVHNVYTGSRQGSNENSDLHAATFPLDLPGYFIENFTNPNELVYEPFAGTGTTILACEQLGRIARAVEISPVFVATALEWWTTVTEIKPERVL